MKKNNDLLPLVLLNAALCRPSDLVKKHSSKNYCILYVSDGKIQVILSRGRYTIKKNAFLFLPPDTSFAVAKDSDPDARLLYIEYTGSDPMLFFSLTKGIYKTRSSPKEDAYHEKVLLSAVHKHEKDASAVLYHYFIFLRRVIRAEIDISVPTNDARILPAIRYIDAHFAEAISLPELATLCGLLPQYFCRLFHELTNKTPVAYITETRMNAAARLLSETDMIEARVAAEVGYMNFNYFLRIFKRYFTLLPSEYRLQKK